MFVLRVVSNFLKKKVLDVKFIINRLKWKKKNSHNGTRMGNNFNLSIVDVGNYTYGVINIEATNNSSKLKIGNYCSIAADVMFLLAVDHHTDTISTFPFRVKVANSVKEESISKGDIVIDDDVWIGYGATIMSGVHIGQGAIIAAGAVVTKDVPPYSIVGGVPAKVIKKRFEQDVVLELLKIDYGKLDYDIVMRHIDDLYVKLESINQLDWMPKK